MPAVSKSQQRLFAEALAYQRGEIKDASDQAKSIAATLSEETIRHYSDTPTKGLPVRLQSAKEAGFAKALGAGALAADKLSTAGMAVGTGQGSKMPDIAASVVTGVPAAGQVLQDFTNVGTMASYATKGLPILQEGAIAVAPALSKLTALNAKLAPITTAAKWTGAAGLAYEGAGVLMNRDKARAETEQHLQQAGPIGRAFYGAAQPMHAINAASAQAGEGVKQFNEYNDYLGRQKKLNDKFPRLDNYNHGSSSSTMSLPSTQVQAKPGTSLKINTAPTTPAQPPAPSTSVTNKQPMPSTPATKQAGVAAPRTGPEAIAYALDNIDLGRLEQESKDVIISKKMSKRPRAVKILNILEGMKRNNLKPSDFMIRQVPVIPPQFRPFSVAGKTFVPGDANELYRDLIQLRDSYTDARAILGDEGTQDTRLALYDSVKALYGYGDPVSPKTKQRGVSGFLKQISGVSPKFSFFQRKMISKPMDSVSRGTITVDPDLSLDEVGIPETMAWTVYKPYIQRRLSVSLGMTPVDALKNVTDQTEHARKALLKEMEERPVIYTRAPSWHKFNVLAGRPKLTEGATISINPLVTTGMNADFNGDQQLGRVMLLIPKELKKDNGNLSFPAHSGKENRNLDLMSVIPLPVVEVLINKNVIPAFDTSVMDLHFVDLEDFPHGELQRHKTDGRQGEIFFYNVAPGLKVIAYDEHSNAPVWADVAFYSVHPQRLIELVDLSNGRQIYTDDDPRAVYGLDPAAPGELVRCTPDEALRRRLLVPCVRDVEQACRSMGTLAEIPWSDESTLKSFPLDFDTGYMLGALAGDGWWDKKDFHGERHIHLSDLSGQVAAKLHDVLVRLWGHVKWDQREQLREDDNSRYGDTVKHSFRFQGSREFSEFLTTWLCGGRADNSAGSGSKSLPDFFLSSGREFREGLLCGLMDTDGSVSVSHGKNKDQLMCSVTSTSMRLLSDTKFLALTLGITSSISFSKLTSRGNTSWILTLSSADCKKQDVFRRLAVDHKRENFLATEVSDQNTSLVFDQVAVPDAVWERVAIDLVNPKINPSDRQPNTPEVLRQMEMKNLYQQWQNVKKDSLASRALIKRLMEYLEENQKENERARQEDTTHLRDSHDDIPPYRNAAYDENVLSWKASFVDNSDMAWAAITAVQKTGIREDGYDLTVPGYETFMSADGVILSNTINVHVPSHPDSVKEAYEKLLPSQMLWSARDQDKVMPVPKQEQILGLFTAVNRPAKKKVSFDSRDQAIQAIRTGQISLSDEVEVPD